MENDSTFSIYRIGPRFAEILSFLENEKFTCSIANYHAVIWEWRENYSYHIGSINESCFVLTTEKKPHPTYAENICTSYEFNSPREDNTICLGMNNYNHEYKDYPNIENGKITFYDYSNNEKNRLIKLPYEDIMYGYVDLLIDYIKVNDSEELSYKEYRDILREYMDKLKSKQVLKRIKDV